jgi:hypothetical protein
MRKSNDNGASESNERAKPAANPIVRNSRADIVSVMSPTLLRQIRIKVDIKRPIRLATRQDLQASERYTP